MHASYNPKEPIFPNPNLSFSKWPGGLLSPPATFCPSPDRGLEGVFLLHQGQGCSLGPVLHLVLQQASRVRSQWGANQALCCTQRPRLYSLFRACPAGVWGCCGASELSLHAMPPLEAADGTPHWWYWRQTLLPSYRHLTSLSGHCRPSSRCIISSHHHNRPIWQIRKLSSREQFGQQQRWGREKQRQVK